MQNSQIENDGLGCYYFCTFYPAKLMLPEKTSYSFQFETNKIVVQINRHLKSLVVNDFGNRIIKTTENELVFHSVENDKIEIDKLNMVVEIEDNGFFIVDHKKHLRKEFFTLNHTEIILSFETTLNHPNYDFSQKVLDFFIESYRMVSEDVLTLQKDKIPFYTKIYKYDFHHYSEEELKLSQEERLKIPRALRLKFHQISIPFWATQGKKIVASKEEIAKKLKDFFSGPKNMGVLNEFILKASEELNVHKNYKYSLIESWTALEIAIVSYTTDHKVKKGISKNKIKDYERDIGVSYLINIELPLIHPTNDTAFKNLLSQIDLIRKLRNNAIHENKSVSETDATNAIKTLVEFLNYIGYKKY
ncbi:MAG TPA: hypothetical protein VI461_17135 [Chitinophagaceae bacterium]|nr:hypothetical protein [Chitinophagaceae bacterium]